MNIRTNLKLESINENELNDINHNLVITGLTYNNRNYIELSVYSQMSKISVPTLRRTIKKIPSNKCSQFLIRNSNKIYITNAVRHIVTKDFSVFSSIKGNWVTYLSGFEWDYFGTVRFKSNYGIDTIRKKVEVYFDKISAKFKGKGIRLFYSLENALNKLDGYHIHFIIWVNHENKSDIKKFTESHFRGKSNKEYANTLMMKYDPNKGGIAYILKEINTHEDSTDFLKKNL